MVTSTRVMGVRIGPPVTVPIPIAPAHTPKVTASRWLDITEQPVIERTGQSRLFRPGRVTSETIGRPESWNA
jgi:hypothetical protein